MKSLNLLSQKISSCPYKLGKTFIINHEDETVYLLKFSSSLTHFELIKHNDSEVMFTIIMNRFSFFFLYILLTLVIQFCFRLIRPFLLGNSNVAK